MVDVGKYTSPMDPMGYADIAVASWDLHFDYLIDSSTYILYHPVSLD